MEKGLFWKDTAFHSREDLAAGTCPQSRHRENRKWCLTIRPRSLFLMIYLFSSQVCPLRFPHTSETVLPLVSGEGLNMDLWLTFYIQTTTPAFWPNCYETMWFDEYENWFFTNISVSICFHFQPTMWRCRAVFSENDHYHEPLLSSLSLWPLVSDPPVHACWHSLIERDRESGNPHLRSPSVLITLPWHQSVILPITHPFVGSEGARTYRSWSLPVHLWQSHIFKRNFFVMCLHDRNSLLRLCQ